MKKLENLAKILFLFFAVVSIGLVTVSCSDDEDEENYCDDCSTEIMVENTEIFGYMVKKGDYFILHYIEPFGVTTNETFYYICNPTKIPIRTRKELQYNKIQVSIKGNIRYREDYTKGKIHSYDLEILTFNKL